MEHTEQNLFLSLNESEQQRIKENAQSLVQLLSIWASCYPMVRAQRITPVSVLVATVLPDLPPPFALLVGKLILFIFLVDDVADERLLSYNAFLAKGHLWEDIARYGKSARLEEISPESEDDLSAILLEIRKSLAQRPLFSALCDLWASRLKALADAMAKEYEYGLRSSMGGQDSLPLLDDYIEGGIHSVGFPFWATSLLILLSEPAMLDQLDRINETIRQTGAAIRLYNDVRTYEKEVQESNINSLTIFEQMIRSKRPGLSQETIAEQAQKSVIEIANRHAVRSCQLVDQVETNSRQFEVMVRRIIAFHANFYASRQHQRDYHTISAQESFEMVQGK